MKQAIAALTTLLALGAWANTEQELTRALARSPREVQSVVRLLGMDASDCYDSSDSSRGVQLACQKSLGRCSISVTKRTGGFLQPEEWLLTVEEVSVPLRGAVSSPGKITLSGRQPYTDSRPSSIFGRPSVAGYLVHRIEIQTLRNEVTQIGYTSLDEPRSGFSHPVAVGQCL